nr:unnamed protein product [Spirometra erinaceieuropaei]
MTLISPKSAGLRLQAPEGKKLNRFEVNESQVAKIIAEVTIARRNAERKLDELRFDEKREIIKAKNLLKAQSSKKQR